MRLLLDSEITSLVANTSAINNEAKLVLAVRALVDRAAELGLVLTVEQRSLQPLAMGHYVTEVSVRPARGNA